MEEALAVGEWVITHAGGVVVAIGVVAAILKFLFGPRVARAIAGVLQPIRDEFAELKQENSDQHEANAQLMRDFRDDFDQKWDAHGKLHQKLAEDIGILRGGQDAIMKGAAKLPQWNAVDEEREAG